MANTSAICSSFKQELLQGKHSFESSGGHTFKLALFDSSATLGASTTDYSTSEEITNTSGTAYTAGGATWVSLHHGGGVGMGFSQHSGVVIVCDGTDEAAERIARVLHNDPATGVMRHADAGYDIAKDCAAKHNLDLPMVNSAANNQSPDGTSTHSSANKSFGGEK